MSFFRPDHISAIENRIRGAERLTGPDIAEIQRSMVHIRRNETYYKQHIAFLESRLRDMHRRAQKAESVKAYKDAYESGVKLGAWMTYEVANEGLERRMAEYKVSVRTTIKRYLEVVRMAALCLRHVLCDPEGKVAIPGSDEDRKIVQDAIEGLEKL